MATVFFDRSGPSSTPNFSSFISLWTLSLAPLVAHVVSGVPQRVYLAQQKPTLLQRLVHWNPTSILWRYFAIVDRRVRAKTWDKAMLATSNALIWTEHGWDGTEAMLNENRLHITRIPKKTHVEVPSTSFLETIVVALQGIQALYQLSEIRQFAQSNISILPMIFVPLALFGLFRLPAAYWLTEEYAFADSRDDDTQRRPRVKQPFRFPSSSSINTYAGGRTFSNASELQPIITTSHDSQHAVDTFPEDQDRSFTGNAKTTTYSTVFPQRQSNLDFVNDSDQFYPASNWRGRLVRTFFLLPTLGLVALAIIYLSITGYRNTRVSATGLSMIITYALFSMVTATLFIANIVSRTSCTTVIPGICSVWYKLYTCVLFVMAAAMFVLASLEQVQPPCDGSVACYGTFSLQDFSLTFNATSNQGPLNLSGYVNASYVFVYGNYGGFMAGTDELGRSFNTSLGS